MTVKVVFTARLQARDAEAKGHHAAAVKGAEDFAADFIGNDEEAEWEKFYVLKSPDFLLEPDDLSEFFVRAELTNRYCGVHGKGRWVAGASNGFYLL
jgi:hypothetical protein